MVEHNMNKVKMLEFPEHGDERMGETLETLYCIKNVDKLNVVHTECKLYT